ncbi:MAG TPA: hypothetical protein DCE41_15340 [Cytophagales bacterium]|nr:hypothetical protein [Cytophagales bacterium]HAA23632.1 hypothetical protein [Cytophagales bacterium]HAP65355.1 hypothetical protein [Cytophagales bacterium]
MGVSLSQASKYDLHIIGFPVKKLSTIPGITFHPHPYFTRLSLKRAVIPFRFFKKCIQLKPELIIVNTHELLIVSCLYKTLFGVKLIYDVQENYYRNLAHTNTYPILLKWPLATYVRLKEWVTRPWINHYFLAEQGYLNEFSFHKANYTVIQNTFRGALAKKFSKYQRSESLNLVLTGTLAEHYGTLDAIEFVKNISKYTSVHLRIVGFAPNKEFLSLLLSRISSDSRFSLVGGAEWVSHNVIVKAIQQADAGIIPYPRHKATQNKLPTRIFEYLAHQLPFFITPLPYWINYCKPSKAAIPVDFESSHQVDALNKLSKWDFYPKGAPREAFWNLQDEPKFLQVIKELLDHK